MDAKQFCYWLQGFAELTNTPQPSEAQWNAIKDHLQLVFKKETPQYSFPSTPSIRQPSVSPLVNNPLLTVTC